MGPNLIFESMKKLVTIVLLLLLGLPAWSQPAQKPLRLGLGLLATSYIGDLNSHGGAWERFSPGASLSLQFDSDHLLSPQLNAGFGKFVSQDRTLQAVDGVQPNTFVQTTFFFVDLRLKARFLREMPVHPYLSAGVGLLGYTPKDADANNLIDNAATRQDGELFGSMTAGLPLSAGLEVRMSPILHLGLEYSYRITSSDYLDNIGLLGMRDGKDKLQSILLSLYITFDPDAAKGNGVIRGRDRN
jgi:Outer membrane protein beta-barrel domain